MESSLWLWTVLTRLPHRVVQMLLTLIITMQDQAVNWTARPAFFDQSRSLTPVPYLSSCLAQSLFFFCLRPFCRFFRQADFAGSFESGVNVPLLPVPTPGNSRQTVPESPAIGAATN